MKLIIVSDSHGREANLREVFSMHRTADMFVHLGDGIREFEALQSEYPNVMFEGVRGNCDIGLSVSGSRFSRELAVISADGYRFLITHGNRQNVEWGTERLWYTAKENKCDAVLFGHTHERLCRHEDGIYLFNPGSVSRPRDGLPPSFGVIETSPGGILCSHGQI